MAQYSTNQFKGGLKILVDGNPCSIIENDIVKPGKGQAFNRVKLKDLINNKVLDKTYKSGELVEAADVEEMTMQYLYNDGLDWYFMHPKSFEQYSLKSTILGQTKSWLVAQDMCVIVLWNGSPISATPPNHVILEVVDTDPGLKGDTAGTANKPATTDSGAMVRVPLFINIGDKIRVDTRSGEYTGKA